MHLDSKSVKELNDGHSETKVHFIISIANIAPNSTLNGNIVSFPILNWNGEASREGKPVAFGKNTIDWGNQEPNRVKPVWVWGSN